MQNAENNTENNTETKIENIMKKLTENLLELQKLGTSEDILNGCNFISKNIQTIRRNINKVNGKLNDNMSIDMKRRLVHSQACKLKARNKNLLSELSSKKTTEVSKIEINEMISKNQAKIDNLKIVFLELNKKKNVSVYEFKQYMADEPKKKSSVSHASFDLKNKPEKMKLKLLQVYKHEYELLKTKINKDNKDSIEKWRRRLARRILLIKKSLETEKTKSVFDINICIYKQTEKYKINKEIKLPTLESPKLTINVNTNTPKVMTKNNNLSDNISNSSNSNYSSNHNTDNEDSDDEIKEAKQMSRISKVKTKKRYDPVTKARMDKLFNMIAFTKDYIDRSPELDMFIMKETKERLQDYQNEYKELSKNYIKNDKLSLM